MEISLGPILGLEADYTYTVCLLISKKIQQTPTLAILIDDKLTKYDHDHTAQLKENHFYRFTVNLPKSENSYQVDYQVLLGDISIPDRHDRKKWSFEVAGRKEVPNIGFTSCNGDSKRLPSRLSSSKFAIWKRMKKQHLKAGERVHLLLMTGDQIYADPLWDEVKLIDSIKERNWLGKKRITEEIVINTTLSQDEETKLVEQLRDFYERLYIESWANLEISFMLSSSPTAMIWDDHDIIDGWGSYSKSMQESQIMQCIFSVATEYFELLQARSRNNSALISSGNPDFSQKISFRNYEFFILDNRTHRTQNRVMSQKQYADINRKLKNQLFKDIPETIAEEKVLCFITPVPIAHLDYHRIVENTLSLPFRKDFRYSLNDDAIDHWGHKKHKIEKKKLLDTIFSAGNDHRTKYVCIVSGDVHVAGAAKITDTTNKTHATQLISSAGVHNPPTLWQYLFITLGSRRIINFYNYKLELKRYGTYKRPTIRKKNFGTITKATKGGMVSTIFTENGKLFFRNLNKRIDD